MDITVSRSIGDFVTRQAHCAHPTHQDVWECKEEAVLRTGGVLIKVGLTLCAARLGICSPGIPLLVGAHQCAQLPAAQTIGALMGCHPFFLFHKPAVRYVFKLSALTSMYGGRTFPISIALHACSGSGNDQGVYHLPSTPPH